MGFKLDRVHVWSGKVADRAGGVAGKLSALAQANANLEFILTRRQPDRPGTGMLYVAPVTGPVQVARPAPPVWRKRMTRWSSASKATTKRVWPTA